MNSRASFGWGDLIASGRPSAFTTTISLIVPEGLESSISQTQARSWISRWISGRGSPSTWKVRPSEAELLGDLKIEDLPLRGVSH